MPAQWQEVSIPHHGPPDPYGAPGGQRNGDGGYGGERSHRNGGSRWSSGGNPGGDSGRHRG